MYKLFIVDDEYVVIQSIKYIIDKYATEVQIVGYAENGREAIQMADILKPDIVFMDVELSGINGIEAIKEIKKKHNCRFVIISAYDYFTYAKEAIQQEVEEYLLKPFDKSEIINTLNKIIIKIEEDKIKRNNEINIKEKLITITPFAENEIVNRIIFGNAYQGDLKKSLDYCLDSSFEEGFALIVTIMSKNDSLDSKSNNEKILSAMRGVIKNHLDCIVGYDINGSIPVFSTALNLNENKIPQAFAKCIQRLYENIKKICKREVQIAVGRVYKGIENMGSSYKEALMVLRENREKPGIIFYDDLFSADGNSEKLIQNHKEKKIGYLEKLLNENIRAGNKFGSLQVYNKLFIEVLNHYHMDFGKVKNRMLEVVVIITKLVADVNADENSHKYISQSYIDEYLSIDSFNYLRGWIKAHIESVCDYIKLVSENQDDSIAALAKKYIQENYHKDINLESVAKKFLVSSSYLSKLFKEEFRENFIDYLTRVRVEKSIDLLKNTTLSIKEISYKLGYGDPNYFCKVFKKVTGYTPTEIRNDDNIGWGDS
jgi:two-component system response regulator YesN